MYQAIVSFVKEVGFPVVIALYLLIIFRKTISENTKAITELTRWIKNSNDKNAKK